MLGFRKVFLTRRNHGIQGRIYITPVYIVLVIHLVGQYMQCVYISTFIVLNMYVISEIHGIHNRVFFSLCFNTFLIHVRFY